MTQSQIDSLLNNVYKQVSGKPYTTTGSNLTNIYYERCGSELKSALYELMLECIGGDGEVTCYMRPQGYMTVNLTESYYNDLRAAQRNKLKELFGEEE